MNTYLTVITTALVVTQIIRVTQNAIQLKRQQKHFDKDLQWLKDTEVTQKDFELQRDTFRLLHEWLKAQEVKQEEETCTKN